MNADKDKPGLRGILSDQDAKVVGDEWRANPPYADKDTATPQSAIKDAERLASVLIGRFPIACEGRHFEGRTCDYCLVDNILRLLRQALDTEGPHNLSGSAQGAADADHTGNTICPAPRSLGRMRESDATGGNGVTIEEIVEREVATQSGFNVEASTGGVSGATTWYTQNDLRAACLAVAKAIEGSR